MNSLKMNKDLITPGAQDLPNINMHYDAFRDIINRVVNGLKDQILWIILKHAPDDDDLKKITFKGDEHFVIVVMYNEKVIGTLSFELPFSTETMNTNVAAKFNPTQEFYSTYMEKRSTF